MLLDALRDFEWYNEPENVRFNSLGMVINSHPNTDFWQSTHHSFHKDNGHFFYTEINRDFELLIKWSFDKAVMFNQCGLMLRFDALNWFKVSLMSEDNQHPQLCSSLTNFGYSDWALINLPTAPQAVWYKVKLVGGDYIASYSLDGVKYHQVRLFHLINNNGRLKAGAYVCSPQDKNFECILELLKIK